MIDERSPSFPCERDPIEVLAAEFVDRHRNGECPSVESYARMNPDLAEEIRDLFPTIARLERLKAAREHTSDWRATAGLPRLMHLGGFRIVRELGRGGMGVVYEAEDTSLKRRVALKVLGANIAGSPVQLQRFRNEAEAAARLHHPHIVPVFGTGEQHGVLFYVMQHVDGMSLGDMIERLRLTLRSSAANGAGAKTASAGPMPAAEANRWRDCRTIVQVALDLADALAYAHSQGVLHRDIKPANVLVDQAGCVWIGDFGVAKHEGRPGLTNTGDLVGTLRYMAPEQFQGQTDARSDIYSLGLTLYELLTLEPAFPESQHGPLINQKTTVPVPSPRLIDPEIPRDLETMTLKACALEPAHRYQTAEEFADDLRRYCEDRPIRARRTSPVERLWRWSHRNPLIAALSGAALVLTVAVAIVFAVGNRRTNEALKSAVNAASAADTERHRAERNLQLAIRALDEIMENVSERGVPQTLQLSMHGEDAAIENVIVTEADAALLQSLLHFFDEFAVANRANLNAQSAAALQRIGAIEQRLGKLAEAEDAFLQSVEIFRKLNAANPEEARLAIDLATTWNRIGIIRSQGGNVPGAFEAHATGLDVLQASAGAAASDAGKFQLAETLNLLGTVGSRAGGSEMIAGMGGPPERGPGRDGSRRPPPPSDRQAVAILRELLDHDPENPAYQFALAKAYRSRIRLGPRAARGEALAKARQAADDALEILRRLVGRFPDSPLYTCELANLLCRAAQRLPDFGHNERAKRLEEALQLTTRLVSAHPQVPEYLALFASVERRLGESAVERGNREEAGNRYRHALQIHDQLATRYSSVSLYQIGYAQALAEWAAIERIAGDIAAARASLEKAVAVAERSAPLWGDDPVFRDFLTHLHRKQRELDERNND